MKKIILAMLCVCLTCTIASANKNFNANANDNAYQLDTAQTLKNSIVAVPAGLTFRGVFLSPISSETAYAGQEVSLALSNDFFYKDKKIAPAGSTVTGTVIEVSKAKHGSLNGKLSLRFTHIHTPSGLDIPISAIVYTPDKTGVFLGGSDLTVTVNDTPTTELTSIKGYVPVYSGMRTGTGAAMGTAVETGGGSLLKSIWDKGEDVEISASTSVTLILTQPITANP